MESLKPEELRLYEKEYEETGRNVRTKKGDYTKAFENYVNKLLKEISSEEIKEMEETIQEIEEEENIQKSDIVIDENDIIDLNSSFEIDLKEMEESIPEIEKENITEIEKESIPEIEKESIQKSDIVIDENDIIDLNSSFDIDLDANIIEKPIEVVSIKTKDNVKPIKNDFLGDLGNLNIDVKENSVVKETITIKLDDVKLESKDNLNISLENLDLGNIDITKTKTLETTSIEETISDSGLQLPTTETKIVPILFDNNANDDELAVIFKVSDMKIWTDARDEQRKKREANKILTKGFFIGISGKPKSGKTRLLDSAVNFKGIIGTRRAIPIGKPVYCVTFNNDAEDEAIRSFSKEYDNGDFVFIDCKVMDIETGLVDPTKSVAKAMRTIFALKNEKVGTLMIDDFSTFCLLLVLAYFKESATVKDDNTGRKRRPKLDQFLHPDKQVSPFEYQYIDRVMLFFLMKLKDYVINVIIGIQLKHKYEESDNKLGIGKKTSDMIEWMNKLTNQFLDLLIRLYKEENKDHIVRKAGILESRFEGKVVPINKSIIEAPDFDDIIQKVMKLYL